jgi:archaemetzincin
MISRPSTIYLIPMGDVSSEHLGIMAESITEQFGLQVKVTANQGPPHYALDEARQQCNSNLILKKMVETCPPDALKALGVTHLDLFSPIFAYVFGEAQFRGRCTVISSFRLDNHEHHHAVVGCPPLINRLEKEAIHELGHTFGLRHCTDADCVMHYSSGLACADRKFAYLCPTCRELMLWHLTSDLFLRV